MSSMLSCLALPAAAPAAAVVSANAAYAQRLQAPKPEPGTGTSSTGSASVVRSQVPHELFDLGSSLFLGMLGDAWCFELSRFVLMILTVYLRSREACLKKMISFRNKCQTFPLMGFVDFVACCTCPWMV
jgi:hypothetical protein